MFISALRIKALLILAASLPWIDYLVICLRLTIQGFLPNCWTASVERAISGDRAVTCLLEGTAQTGYLLSSGVFSKLRAEPYLVSVSGQEGAHHFSICSLFLFCWKQSLENQPSDPAALPWWLGRSLEACQALWYSERSTRLGVQRWSFSSGSAMDLLCLPE